MLQNPKKKPKLQNKKGKTRCPICGEKVSSAGLATNKLFPFCSKRCKMIDLGKWFSGDYSFSRELEPGDEEPEE